MKPESYPWINPFLYPLIMFTFLGWYTQTLILFQGCSQHPHVPWIDVWSHHSHRGFTHIWDRLGCVNLGEMGLWIGSSHYPTPSTSINPSSTQFSSVRRASWPGAPKASWTGPFVARELDVSLQKCASPRKPMNISTRNPVMSPSCWFTNTELLAQQFPRRQEQCCTIAVIVLLLRSAVMKYRSYHNTGTCLLLQSLISKFHLHLCRIKKQARDAQVATKI